MILDAQPVGPFQANCYLLGCEQTREALVIDPGDDAERIAALIMHHELQPVTYLHTHGHVDHVGATAALKARFGGQILLHEADLHIYERAHESAFKFGLVRGKTVPVDGFVSEGDDVTWGKSQGTILHTPGHSPGGICLQVAGKLMPRPEGSMATTAAEDPDWVFTGDTLFQGSIGRTDFTGGSMEDLLRSIQEKLLVLPDETIVASGHGPLTTIGAERRTNPFLQGGF